MPPTIERLAVGAADDTELLTHLVGLINQSYAQAEEGLWLQGVHRTDIAQLRAHVAAGQIMIAHLDGELAGTVQARGADGGDVTFGQLAVHRSVSGRGVGAALVQQVESEAAAAGARTVRLEVLRSTPPLAYLEQLANWYSRLGYRETGRAALDQISPHEAPFLARACEAVIMEKVLRV